MFRGKTIVSSSLQVASYIFQTAGARLGDKFHFGGDHLLDGHLQRPPMVQETLGQGDHGGEFVEEVRALDFGVLLFAEMIA